MTALPSPSWIELDIPALKRNFHFFRNRIQRRTTIYPVVKANAYGHGMTEIVNTIQPLADGFCVHSAKEAARLPGGKPVLILGHFPDDMGFLARLMLDRQPVFTITSASQAAFLDRAAKAAKASASVHIKVETGTHRLGLQPDEARALALELEAFKNIHLSGFSTHFANIEDTINHQFAMEQLSIFNSFRQSLPKSETLRFHCSCSAAALLFPETHMDMVRLGISLYGYYSSGETRLSAIQQGLQPEDKLRPVLSWKTQPIQIKSVAVGDFVGYGLTFRAHRPMTIAVLPVGYSDGYDRRLSNSAYVLFRGQRAPICGRICMNLMMVDVSHIDGADRDDIVTLIGRDGNEEITAETLAEIAGTIQYEILARINPDIPRISVD
ncbi:MAG: alanine racemase [Acidobacteria bacterium]|nr:MAG: alanine racemase [Acidobacteriota bacterium]